MNTNETSKKNVREQEFLVSAMFSDHMVLQQNKRIAVWGSCPAGSQVTVSLAGQTAEADVQGERWQAYMEPLAAGGPYELEVMCGAEKKRMEDVMVGEVWLAGGQSNMELELQNSDDGELEIAAANDENIRFYNVVKTSIVTEKIEQQQRKQAWKLCKKETIRDVSAVAYFCAKKLYEELQVPIGVIDCYIGGTSVTCWMDEATLEKTSEGRDYIERYDQLIGNKTEEEYQAEMEAYQREWQEWDNKVQAERKKNPDVTWEYLNEHIGSCPWPQPAGRTSNFRPANPYHGMLERVIPYTLRGFWYYQGEEDTYKAEGYGVLLEQLISFWRSQWQDADAPFILNQLPMYIAKGESDDKSWAILREQQYQTTQRMKQVYMNVLIDCGEYDNIHPTDKRTVGERMALLCRKQVYKCAEQDLFPMCQSVSLDGSQVIVLFDGAELQVQGEELHLFELAGTDGNFYPAEARLVSAHEVWLSSDKVLQPMRVRYAWTNYGTVTLFDVHGLPAAPFYRSTK